MTYVAKPVLVEAHQITQINRANLHLTLANGQTVVADRGMVARYMPTVGDYWVIQADGYTYLNPKDVFERKYEPVELFTPDRRPTDPQR